MVQGREDSLLVVTVGVMALPKGDTTRGPLTASPGCVLVHGAQGWISEQAGEDQGSRSPRECEIEGQEAVLTIKKVHLLSPAPLPAAAPAPSSLLRGACADKTPFVRVTGGQDTVTSCVDGKQ